MKTCGEIRDWFNERWPESLACQWDKPLPFESKDWVTVTAKVSIKFSPVYGKRGPVLQVLSVEPAEAPEQEVATFY